LWVGYRWAHVTGVTHAIGIPVTLVIGQLGTIVEVVVGPITIAV